MPTKQQVKQGIDTDITNKSAVNSITPANVGNNMKAVVDLIPDYSFLSLPTPQVTKRKLKLNNTIDDPKIREDLNSVSTRRNNAAEVAALVFPEEYYKERFDITFNSYGTTNNWLLLPEKRLELCMVATRKNKKLFSGNNGEGTRDYFTKRIVHPANGGTTNENVLNTIYSGGRAIGQKTNDGSPIQPGISQTEWAIDEENPAFGDNIFTNSLNAFNNPGITVELDVRDFFRTRQQLFSYPYELDHTGVQVKKIGTIKKNNSGRIYRRNSVLFFRLSAGIPETWNEVKQRYDKRVFSDLSTPIYICPKMANFLVDLEDKGAGLVPYIFGHITTIGVKNG